MSDVVCVTDYVSHFIFLYICANSVPKLAVLSAHNSPTPLVGALTGGQLDQILWPDGVFRVKLRANTDTLIKDEL